MIQVDEVKDAVMVLGSVRRALDTLGMDRGSWYRLMVRHPQLATELRAVQERARDARILWLEGHLDEHVEAKVLNAVKVHTQTLEEANGLLTEKVNEYGSKLEYLTNQNALCQANTVVLQEELVEAKEPATGGIIEMTFLDLLRELKNRIIRF